MSLPYSRHPISDIESLQILVFSRSPSYPQFCWSHFPFCYHWSPSINLPWWAAGQAVAQTQHSCHSSNSFSHPQATRCNSQGHFCPCPWAEWIFKSTIYELYCWRSPWPKYAIVYWQGSKGWTYNIKEVWVLRQGHSLHRSEMICPRNTVLNHSSHHPQWSYHIWHSWGPCWHGAICQVPLETSGMSIMIFSLVLLIDRLETDAVYQPLSWPPQCPHNGQLPHPPWRRCPPFSRRWSL